MNFWKKMTVREFQFGGFGLLIGCVVMLLIFGVAQWTSRSARSGKWNWDTERWIEVKKDGTEVIHLRKDDGMLR